MRYLPARRTGSDGNISASGSAGPGFDPGWVVNFHLEIFNLGARRGGDVHFLIARVYITSQDKIPNPSALYIYMLRRHIVLLIVIRPSDGDVKPGGPLGAFRVEQAMSQHRVSPSPFLTSSSHRTQLHYTNSYTYSHPNLTFSNTL